MQVETFLVTYHPGLDGSYRVSWSFEIDGYVHRLLAELAGLTASTAYLIHVQQTVVRMTCALASDLRDPEAEVPVYLRYRVNQLPTTYTARILLYAGDLETLELLDDLASPTLPC